MARSQSNWPTCWRTWYKKRPRRSCRGPLSDQKRRISPVFEQFRHCGEQVCNQTEIRDLKDRRFFVFVDRHDDFAVFHTGQMLNRAGNTYGNIKLWRDNLAVCPTCQSLGAYPESTAAREAPTAAPSLSASFSIRAKSSSEPTPRPPDTTTPADVNSGRSLAATLSSTHSLSRGLPQHRCFQHWRNRRLALRQMWIREMSRLFWHPPS